jgi:hypothetical protein
MISVAHEARQSVLIYSAAITSDPEDVIAIVITSSLLLDWLEAAEDQGDLRLRLAAMHRHYVVSRFLAGTSEMTPSAFMAGVRALYDLVTAAIDPPAAAA